MNAASVQVYRHFPTYGQLRQPAAPQSTACHTHGTADTHSRGGAGDQVSAEARGVLGIKDFTGEVVFASRQHGADCTLGDAGHMQYKVHSRDPNHNPRRTLWEAKQVYQTRHEVSHMVPLWMLLVMHAEHIAAQHQMITTLTCF